MTIHVPAIRSIHLLTLCCIGLLMSMLTITAGSLPEVVAHRIDTTQARRLLTYLSSDERGGRNTPSAGLDDAANYIVQELRASGVEPIQGSYFHDYILERVDLDTPTTMRLTHEGITYDCVIKSDLIPFDQTGEGSFSTDRVVFVGFGVTAPEYNYDDYAGIDVRGAIVVAMRSEPLHPTDTAWFNGKGYTRYQSLTEKVRNAKAHGAAALLVFDGIREPKKLTVTGFPWPALYPNITIDALPLTLPDEKKRSMPVLHVGDTVLNRLFGSVTSLVDRILRIDTTRKPQSFELHEHTVSINVRLRKDTVRTRNIVGFVKGAEIPDEYVIMGAHYDHIGVSKDTTNVDRVYNGADDNGSGTTGLLLTAKAIAESPFKPKRSMLFIHFSGEEKGLLGSKAYARSPVLPLDNCVAMINMDMIGRCENNKLSIGGNLRCPDLTAINEEENNANGRPYQLAYDIEHYFFRSDQASFAQKRIPVLFYFTGEHADYHKLSDEIGKIKFDDLVGIARLAASTAWRAAELPRTRYLPAGWEE